MAAALPVRSVAASRARRHHRLRVLGFMSPWLVGFTLFFAYPLAATVYFSFFRYNLFQLTPIGLTNYRFLLHDPYAWTAIKNTLWLVAVLVPPTAACAPRAWPCVATTYAGGPTTPSAPS